MGTCHVLLYQNTIDRLVRDYPFVKVLDQVPFDNEGLFSCILKVPEFDGYVGCMDIIFKEDGSLRFKRDVDV